MGSDETGDRVVLPQSHGPHFAPVLQTQIIFDRNFASRCGIQ